jgi:hypothetical protein
VAEVEFDALPRELPADVSRERADAMNGALDATNCRVRVGPCGLSAIRHVDCKLFTKRVPFLNCKRYIESFEIW